MHMRTKLRRCLFPAVSIAVLAHAVVSFALRAGEDPTASQQRVLADIKYLASDELEGRGIGTKGLDLASDYIRDQFQQAGLKPALPDGSYFQSFEMRSGSKLGKTNQLALHGPDGRSVELALGKNFIPLVTSGSGKIDSPIIFVGYGITAPEHKYDDYANADVKGKAVLVLGKEPAQTDKEDPHAPFSGNIDTKHASLSKKASNAMQHGATAVLIVNDTYSLKSQPDKLPAFEPDRGTKSAQIPLLHVTRDAADQVLLASLNTSLSKLEAAIDLDLKPHTAELGGWSCSGEITVEKQMATVKNVIGVLEGSGPHADETIVLGAHYDHLGYGGEDSLAPGSREIHNGADDNASGTTGIMELGRRLAHREKPFARRVVFMTFTGEERGLVGSNHYVEHPIFPLKQTVAMINLDMVGRLRNDKLIVEGTGTATEFKPLVESLNSERHFDLRPIARGTGPSDQTSFYQKEIPVLFFWTDYHPDYHKPSDDWDKISIEGLDRVISMVESVTVSLASADTRPTFVKVAEPVAKTDPTAGDRPWLGSIPAFGEEVDGALLSGVTPGSPADKGGIRGGDLIVRIGDMEIHGLQDLQDALVSHKPGDVVKVTVLRGGLRITYPVTLGRRPS